MLALPTKENSTGPKNLSVVSSNVIYYRRMTVKTLRKFVTWIRLGFVSWTNGFTLVG